MNGELILRLTGSQKHLLKSHLFPGDGLEAVALLLCGRRSGKDRHCLSVMEVVVIPYDECERLSDRVTWPTALLEPLLQRAAKESLAVVKVHSHPGGYDRFSETDDASDVEFFDAAESWNESDLPHGSVVLLPCGRMFGRYMDENQGFRPFSLISIAGEMIEYWADEVCEFVPDFADRHAQVLGEDTIGIMRQLRCAVIGGSGTGSPTIEQLFRLGIGELILIDPDHVGPENLNRIINSRGYHAQQRAAKVDVLANAINESELGTTVIPIQEDLCNTSVVELVATCDVIFGCVDSVFARHLLNKIAATYCIPYVDIGVGIKADGAGGIAHITGAVHYLQPDRSSLLSRQVFTLDEVQADGLRRSDPDEYKRRIGSGYIKGADVARPAVMPVNMVFSGLGVYEFLCRLHELRDEGNTDFASQRWSLSSDLSIKEPDCERCKVVSRYLGRGDMNPLLGMPELTPVKGNIDVAN